MDRLTATLIVLMSATPDDLGPQRERPMGSPGGARQALSVLPEPVDRLGQRGTRIRLGDLRYPPQTTVAAQHRMRGLPWVVGLSERDALGLPRPGHWVALDRVARAISAAVRLAPDGVWACNVVDRDDFTYAGATRAEELVSTAMEVFDGRDGLVLMLRPVWATATS